MIDKVKRALKYILHGVPSQTVLKCSVVVSKSAGRLNGKHVLVTGGGRGLGYFIARKCVEEGAEVLITGRNEETLKQASKELNCKYKQFDVTDVEHVGEFMDSAKELLGGRIDCLVNNAGISLHEKGMMEVTPDTFNRQIDTNLKGPYFLSQSFIRHCIETDNHNAAIVFVSSERGLYCDEIPYGLTKAAINSLTRGMARRHIRHGIRVNAVAPGITESDMTIADRNSDMTCEYNCGGRFFLPEEVAEAVAYLLSDAAGCVSGEVIACDQGNYLRSDW